MFELARISPFHSVRAARLNALFAVALALGVLTQITLPIGPAGLSVSVSDALVAVAIPYCLIVLSSRKSLGVQSLVPRLGLWLVPPTVALTIAFAIGWSRLGLQSWGAMRLIGWFAVLGHLLVGAWIASDASARRLAVQVFAIGAAAAVLADVFVIFTMSVFVPPDNCYWVGAARGLTSNPNAYGFMLLMALCVIVSQAREGVLGSSQLNFLLMSMIVFALVLTSSRSAWTAAIAVSAVMLLRGLTRPLPLVAGTAVGTFLTAVLLGVLVCSSSAALTTDVQALSKIATEPATMDPFMVERVHSQRRAIEMFLENPLFGTGLGVFFDAEIAAGTGALIIHSTPLWLLAEAGLVGGISFAVAAFAVAIALARHIRNGLPHVVSDARTALALLLAFGIMSLAQELLYQRSLWFLLGLFLFRPRAGEQTTSGTLGDAGTASLASSRFDNGARRRPSPD